MKARLESFCVATCIALTLTACGTARRGEPFTRSAVAADAQLEDGAKVFYEHCHKCHTGGEAALGPALNNKPLPAFMLRFQVRQGLGVMPEFAESQISEDELDDLVAYLTALRRLPAG